MPRTKRPIAERFWEKVNKGPGCWTWTAAIDKTKGYGVFMIGRQEGTRNAHIVSWELTHGSRGGLWVLHHCDNPPCVRPDHLYLGTVEDNGRDMSRRARSRSSKITECPQGHPYDEQNTFYYMKSNGRMIRRCRICKSRQRRERYLRTGN